MIMQNTDSPQEPVALTCVSCGTEMVDHGGYCFSCQTPLALSRSVAGRGRPARFVSVLGASGAGKTVYLGFLLDVLSKGAKGLRGLPNGAFSIAVQQQTIAALQRRRFPEKTPTEADSWQWVHCEVTRERRPKNYVDIITPDFAGEAIAQEVERPDSFRAIRFVVVKSQALLLLFDSRRVRDAGREEDFFAMKLASYINTTHQQDARKNRGRLKTPIAVVLTKADLCPEVAEDPQRFAAANLPGLIQFCKRNFSRHRFFAASVVGSSVMVADHLGRRRQIPLHVEPYGVIEPLEWIMRQLA